jgi:hypothetical protein
MMRNNSIWRVARAAHLFVKLNMAAVAGLAAIVRGRAVWR